MDNIAKDRINDFVDKLRDAFSLDLPTNVEQLVEMLKGKIDDDPNLPPGVEAKIERSPRGSDYEFIITLLPFNRKYKNRRTFSIAHEVGHLFLHMGYLVNPELWDSSDPYLDGVYYRFGYSAEEREANEFAGALLMPKSKYITTAKRFFVDGEFQFDAIARVFGVSRDAAKTRARNLGLIRGDY